MGQFSFRVSSTVTVRKWLELGSSQRFFSLMCLILESGRLKKLGLWGYFSLSLSLLEWLSQGDPADGADSSDFALDITQQQRFSCTSLSTAVPKAQLVPREGSWTLPPMRGGPKNLTLQNHHVPSHALFPPVTQFTFISATDVTSFLWSKITLYADKISIHILLT